MLKPFNGKEYIIKHIEEKDIPILMSFVKRLGIKMQYPDMFKKHKIWDCIAIDDEMLYGHVSVISRHYSLDIIKRRNMGTFPNIKELRYHLISMGLRKEIEFIYMKNVDEYHTYLRSLTKEKLEVEGRVVAGIISTIDYYYEGNSEAFKDDLIQDMQKDIDNGKDYLTVVKETLNALCGVRSELDDLFDIYLYLYNDNKKNLKLDSISKLLKEYEKFHHYNSNYAKLHTLNENLHIIFLLFNFKLNCEGKISYKDVEFEPLKKLGYINNVPDYLVGTKTNDKWDEKSVYDRFVKAVKLINCGFHLCGNNIFLPYVDNLDDYKTLTNKLIEMGYKADVLFEKPKGMIITPETKTFGSRDSETILACYCSSNGISHNLSVGEFLKNLDDILINFDLIKYNELLLKKENK